MKSVGKVLLASLLVVVLIPVVSAGFAAVIGMLGLTLAAPWVMVPVLVFGAGGVAISYLIVKAVIMLIFHR